MSSIYWMTCTSGNLVSIGLGALCLIYNCFCIRSWTYFNFSPWRGHWSIYIKLFLNNKQTKLHSREVLAHIVESYPPFLGTHLYQVLLSAFSRPRGSIKGCGPVKQEGSEFKSDHMGDWTCLVQIRRQSGSPQSPLALICQDLSSCVWQGTLGFSS